MSRSPATKRLRCVFTRRGDAHTCSVCNRSVTSSEDNVSRTCIGPQPLTLVQIGRNLLTAVGDALAGRWVVEREKARRLAICQDCTEHFNPSTSKCDLCTCYMPLKTRLKSMDCPIGKW